MIECGADVNKVDHLGWHAGHYAAQHGHDAITMALVEAGMWGL